MNTQQNAQDIFDLDVREVAEPAVQSDAAIANSGGIPTLCGSECAGDCCTLANR